MKKTLLACILAYVESRKSFLKESTYARYRNLIDNYIRSKIGTIELSEFNNWKLQYYCDSIIEQKVQCIYLLLNLSILLLCAFRHKM